MADHFRQLSLSMAVVLLIWFFSGACSTEVSHRDNIIRTGGRIFLFSTYLRDVKSVGGTYPITVFDTDGYVLPLSLRQVSERNPVNLNNELRYDSWRFYEVYKVKGYKGEKHSIQYLSNGRWYLLLSCGPDRVYEVERIRELWANRQTATSDTLRVFRANVEYDPTNGTKSRGDLVVGSPETGFDILDRPRFYGLSERYLGAVVSSYSMRLLDLWEGEAEEGGKEDQPEEKKR